VADYDIITVGGGIGGSAIAKAMAERGYRVLALERETKFKDRVRGEWMAPWGVAETKELGIHDALLAAGGHHTPVLAGRAGPAALPPRNLVTESALGLPCLTMYHPDLQETVLTEAGKAGAEVRRGVKVTKVTPGGETTVEIDGGEAKSARLVVGADGRNSMVRKWAGFEARESKPEQLLAGVFLENVPIADTDNVAVFNPFLCQIAFIFPQKDGKARAYFGCRTTANVRLQGDGDFQKLIDMSVQTGTPSEFYSGVKQAGPVASFEGYDSWVEHPYKDGVALVGDAAQTSDQTWGQGLSITLKDARLLRDALLATDDWDAAGHKYAAAANESYEHIQRVEDWMTLVFMTPGPEADAVRAGTLPRLAVDPSILPDTHMVGPELAPADEAARIKFLGS
jgi:2-polyprenyl-6-methoxyphenol hydroxylase-like FAD-dependent oxidoreductase